MMLCTAERPVGRGGGQDENDLRAPGSPGLPQGARTTGEQEQQGEAQGVRAPALVGNGDTAAARVTGDEHVLGAHARRALAESTDVLEQVLGLRLRDAEVRHLHVVELRQHLLRKVVGLEVRIGAADEPDQPLPFATLRHVLQIRPHAIAEADGVAFRTLLGEESRTPLEGRRVVLGVRRRRGQDEDEPSKSCHSHTSLSTVMTPGGQICAQTPQPVQASSSTTAATPRALASMARGRSGQFTWQ
jgi:hypothetical protein